MNAVARFLLGVRCFFLLLLGRRLPMETQAFLPPPPLPGEKPVETVREVVKPDPEAEARGATKLLALLQREGRLVDFLEEEIDSYSDAQVGASVRDIHRACKKALDDHLALTAVMKEHEDQTVKIPEGFDAAAIRLVGEVVGKPPFQGVLRHPGWRVSQLRLPEVPTGHDPMLVAPAEVELGAMP